MKTAKYVGKALVVLSGGQDSTTCLYIAKEEFEEVHAVTFDYGQRHCREIDAAQIIAGMAGVASWSLISIPAVLRSVSPLVSDAKLETYSNFKEMSATIGDRVELTFVPMRNALFLTIAANFARAINCRDLYTGVCEADNANYPDCRASFISAQEWAIQEALADESFEIHTPLIDTTKAESIRLAKTLPGCMDALAYSHTSYSGEYPPVTQDHSTVLRAQGFLEADVPDPLIVRAWREGRMILPTTPNYYDLHSAAGNKL